MKRCDMNEWMAISQVAAQNHSWIPVTEAVQAGLERVLAVSDELDATVPLQLGSSACCDAVCHVSPPYHHQGCASARGAGRWRCRPSARRDAKSPKAVITLDGVMGVPDAPRDAWSWGSRKSRRWVIGVTLG